MCDGTTLRCSENGTGSGWKAHLCGWSIESQLRPIEWIQPGRNQFAAWLLQVLRTAGRTNKPAFSKQPIPILASVSKAEVGYAGTYPDGPGMCWRTPVSLQKSRPKNTRIGRMNLPPRSIWPGSGQCWNVFIVHSFFTIQCKECQ